MAQRDEEKDQLFRLRFQEVFREGEKAFKKYIKKSNLQNPHSEKKAYSIIKNA